MEEKQMKKQEMAESLDTVAHTHTQAL